MAWPSVVVTLLVLAGSASVAATEPSRSASQLSGPSPRPGGSGLSVVVENGRVSLSAHGVELAAVLAELSRQAGFTLSLDAALEARAARETRTTALQDLSPEHAVRRLLAPASLVFVYARDGLAEVLAYDDPRGTAREVRTPVPGARTKPRPMVEGTGPVTPKPRPLVESSAMPIDKPVPVFDGPSGEKPAPLGPADEPLTDTEQARPDPAALEAQVLSATDAAVRWRAMEDLAQSGDTARASSTASRVLAQERDPEVLERALTVLSDQESVPLEPLLLFASSQGEASLRVRSLQMLVERGESDSRISELLTRLARSDRSADVRESAKGLLEDLRRTANAR